jgi:hypothetical protein
MSNKISPLWNPKLKELFLCDFVANDELQECFEKLYSIYDENFKPTKDLYFIRLQNQKSMISTCEPTPNCQTIENSNTHALTRRNRILESNQNITNDSFIDTVDKNQMKK